LERRLADLEGFSNLLGLSNVPVCLPDWRFYFEEQTMRDFQTLQQAFERHGHLCAGQVLGVRMTLRALRELGIDVDREPKRVIVYVEIDRCAADAVATVARVSLGKQTLKYRDYGKMAATFVDTQTQRACRVVALESARERARQYTPGDMEKRQAELIAYQQMPDEELFNVHHVAVAIPDFDQPGHPLRRVECVRCGEGINDGREVVCAGETLCRACASGAYYERVDAVRHPILATL
jgi:formylmethanofuran dehydrogenase subunit E